MSYKYKPELVRYYKAMGFEVGKEVVSTKLAEHYGVFTNRTLGVVSGFSREPKIILVTVVGNKSQVGYHWTFWRAFDAPEPEAAWKRYAGTHKNAKRRTAGSMTWQQIIAEWRRGCSCADQSKPWQCLPCTWAAIKALIFKV